MGMITFENIPTDILTPGTFIEFDNSNAVQGLSIMPHKILVFGQKLASGLALDTQPVLLFNALQAEVLGGTGSMMHRMVRALKLTNSTTEVWGVFLPDAVASVAAAGSITFTGAPTDAGVVPLYVNGVSVPFLAAKAATAVQIATLAVAAINAKKILPVTAAVDGVLTSKIVLTARNKGACGNDIDVRFAKFSEERLPAGLAAAIVPMTGGAGNPDVTDVFTSIGDDWYTTYAMPYTDAPNLAAFEAELLRRSGPMVMTDALAYAAVRGSQGTLAAHGLTRNSQWLCTIGMNKGLETPEEWAASFAGAAAFAAAIDPAQPVSDIPLTGISAPAKTDVFTREERDILLHNGIGTWIVDASGRVILERAITGFRLDGHGLPDRSYLDSETLRTLSYLRYTMRTRFSARFRRKKLAKDGTRGPNVVTPSLIRAELVALFKDWEDLGLVQDIDQFKRDVRVEISLTDPNRVNIIVPSHLINQLRVLAAAIQFIL